MIYIFAGQKDSGSPTSCMRDQRLWSVQECADIFATSLNSLKADLEKEGDNGILVWDKVHLSGNSMYFLLRFKDSFINLGSKNKLIDHEPSWHSG